MYTANNINTQKPNHKNVHTLRTLKRSPIGLHCYNGKIITEVTNNTEMCGSDDQHDIDILTRGNFLNRCFTD